MLTLAPDALDVRRFVHQLDAFGVTRRPDIDHAMTLIDTIATDPADTRPAPSLGMTPDELLDLAREQALGALIDRAVLDQLRSMLDALTQREVLPALRDDADRILDQLRPTFDAAAAAVTAATLAGIHAGITDADVIHLPHPDAVPLWRDLPTHTTTLDRIATVRIAMCDTLYLHPITDQYRDEQQPPDYSICFGGPNADYTPRRGLPPGHRWLALAAAGALRLRTLAETAAARPPVRRAVSIPVA